MVNFIYFKNKQLNMDAEEKIYNAFFNSKTNKLYYSQIKDITKMSHSSLQNILKKLVEKNILAKEKTKSNVFYKIKNKKIFSIKFSEIAINKFEDLNVNVRIPLKNLIKKMPITTFTIILFGSTVEKKERKNSDIDIVIIKNSNKKIEKIKDEINSISNHPLNIFEFSVKEFIKNKDPIIIQSKKRGIPIYKEQNFYEVILNEY